MILPYLRVQILRWSRRPAGQATAILALVFPAAIGLYWVWDYRRHPQILPELPSVLRLSICLLGLPFVANLTAAAVHDERRGRTARLLRVRGFLGGRPVIAFFLLSVTLATIVAALGAVAAGISALAAGTGVLPGVRAAAFAWLALVAIGPPALAAGYILPRALAFVLVNLGSIAMLSFLLSGSIDPFTTLLLCEGPLLVVLALVWRLTAHRLWS